MQMNVFCSFLPGLPKCYSTYCYPRIKNAAVLLQFFCMLTMFSFQFICIVCRVGVRVKSVETDLKDFRGWQITFAINDNTAEIDVSCVCEIMFL